MVRTKADAGSSKIAVAKAPRKILGGGSASASSSNSPCRSLGGASKDRYSGGNSYNSQPTPKWQKGIGTFFKPEPESKNKEKDKTLEKKEMECSGSEEICNENSEESSKSPPQTQSPKCSKEVSAEDSEEKSFTKNGVISDDDD